MGGQTSKECVQSPRAEAALAAGVASLFDEPRWSDFVVHCRSRGWKVHKNIICLGCDFFAKAAEGEFKEAALGSIRLDDDPEDAVHAMLSFLYKANYDPPTTAQIASSLMHDLQVWIVADKYNLPLLGELALQKFVKAAEKDWQKSEFAQAVQEIYNIDTGHKQKLREEAVKVCTAHAVSLLKTDDPQGEELRAVMATNGEFASALLLSIAAKLRKKSAVE